MKKLIFILFIVIGSMAMNGQTLKKSYFPNRIDPVQVLRDSIRKLNQRPVMTEKEYIEVYKYETLLKYYRLTKSRPSNKKYYYGWSARVFDK